MRKGSKCKVYSHTNVETGEQILKDKKKYLRPEQAIAEADRLNKLPKQIHKLFPYKCTSCHFFHIGRHYELNLV